MRPSHRQRQHPGRPGRSPTASEAAGTTRTRSGRSCRTRSTPRRRTARPPERRRSRPCSCSRSSPAGSARAGDVVTLPLSNQQLFSCAAASSHQKSTPFGSRSPSSALPHDVAVLAVAVRDRVGAARAGQCVRHVEQHGAAAPVVPDPVAADLVAVAARDHDAHADRHRDARLHVRPLLVGVEVVRVDVVVLEHRAVLRVARMTAGEEGVGGDAGRVVVEVVVHDPGGVAHRARVADRVVVHVAARDQLVQAPGALSGLLAGLRRGARVDAGVAVTPSPRSPSSPHGPR